MPVDLKNIKAEVEGGLPNSYSRRWEAKQALDFASMDFERYPIPNKDGRYDSELPPRYSPIMNRVIGVLSGYLYKGQPVRKLEDPLTSEWLARVYKSNRMWAKWKRADELAGIGGFCGFQFSGSPDPQAPVKVTQWGPHELEVFTDPDDPAKVAGVATIDAFDSGQRLRLYTETEIIEYEKEKGLRHEALGSASWRYRTKKANPYRTLPDEENPEGKGLIPFTFAHWFYPTSDFTTASPGPILRRINENLNIILSRLGDSVPYLAFPLGIASGVDAAWKPPLKVKPGDWIPLVASDVDAAGNGPVPQLAYLAPELAYLEAIWQDTQNLIDHELEMLNVPPALVRMVQSAARSGLSIQAEQLPLVSWVEGRRPQWADYEDDAARMACLLGYNWLSQGGYAADANRLRAALEDWSFTLRWPSLYTMLPGPERNAEDDWRLQRGFISKVGVLMERHDMTEQEAFDHLKRVEAENQRLESLGVESGTEPTAGQFPGQYSGFSSAQGEGQDQQQEPRAAEPEAGAEGEAS